MRLIVIVYDELSLVSWIYNIMKLRFRTERQSILQSKTPGQEIPYVL